MFYTRYKSNKLAEQTADGIVLHLLVESRAIMHIILYITISMRDTARWRGTIWDCQQTIIKCYTVTIFVGVFFFFFFLASSSPTRYRGGAVWETHFMFFGGGPFINCTEFVCIYIYIRGCCGVAQWHTHTHSKRFAIVAPWTGSVNGSLDKLYPSPRVRIIRIINILYRFTVPPRRSYIRIANYSETTSVEWQNVNLIRISRIT